MKRSKIFLGATTCLLAIAGIAAAKRFDSSRTRFYCTVTTTNGYCASKANTTYTFTSDQTKPIATVTIVSGLTYHQPLYTQGTVGTECNVGAVNGCANLLYYSNQN